MATTEELARRFCELVGWEYRLTDERLFFSPGPGKPGVRGNLHPFPSGWQGIGIVVEECLRRGIAIALTPRLFYDGAQECEAWMASVRVEPARTRQHYFRDEPLDAVLTAAIAAIEAEARP